MKGTIIVTGGSQGIGKAIASRLLKDGHKVILVARDAEKLAKAAADLDGADHYAVDLASPDAIAAFTKTVSEPIYGVVNNAGICKTARIDEDMDPYAEVIATNLTGPYLLTRSLLPKLIDGGRIVNISSQLGIEGRAGYGAYSASKFGLIGLTKCWAKELGSRGITVNAVCPGWVWTDMTDIDLARLAEEAGVPLETYKADITSQLELDRFNQPEEIAGLVSYLLSSDAGGISGRDWILQSVTN